MGKRGKRRRAAAREASAKRRRKAAAEEYPPQPPEARRSPEPPEARQSPEPPEARQPLPLRIVFGERANTDKSMEDLTWTCSCGKVHLPRRGIIADIPVLMCVCGRECEIEFDFSIGNVTINDKSPITQDNVKLQMKKGCTLAATSSNVEITLQMRQILSGEQVEGTTVDMRDFHRTLQKARKQLGWGRKDKWNEHTLVELAHVAKECGVKCDEGQGSKIHKIPEFVRVNNTFYDITRVLSDGHPLTAGITPGKNFPNLKPGQIYKAPGEEKLKVPGKSRTGHAIVLIGAGRRKKTNYYHFINSWGEHFCMEEDGRYGFGMVRASDIDIYPVKFVRYKEDIEYHKSLASTA